MNKYATQSKDGHRPLRLLLSVITVPSAVHRLFCFGFTTIPTCIQYYRVMFICLCAVTEFEIHDGLLKATKPSQHVICFLRRFSGLTDNVTANENNPNRYIDISIQNDQVGSIYIVKKPAKKIETLRNMLV